MRSTTAPREFPTFNQLLIFAIVIIITAIGQLIWDHHTSRISTYSDCVDASSSHLLTSYPSICVTKDNTQYTNPTEKNILPPKQTHKNSSSQSTIDIKEWGVRLSVAAPDTSYSIKDDGSIYITTAQLEKLLKQVKGCKSGLHGLTIGHDLKERRPIEPLCPTGGSAVEQQISDIEQKLRNSLANPQTIPNICAHEAELSASCAKAQGVN